MSSDSSDGFLETSTFLIFFFVNEGEISGSFNELLKFFSSGFDWRTKGENPCCEVKCLKFSSCS